MLSHKYTRCLLGVFGVLLAFYVVSFDTAYAQTGITFPQNLDREIAGYVTKAISFLNILAWICFLFLTILLDPRFIFDLNPAGTGSSLVNMLNEIWVLSRNLVNIGFAFALIGAAIYIIIFPDKKDLVKEYAPKFILAVVLVNFSWFFPRVIYDVSNVVASAVYGVPNLVNSECKVFIDCGKVGEYQAKFPGDPQCSDEPSNGMCMCLCKMVVDAKFFVKESCVGQPKPCYDELTLKNQGYEPVLGRALMVRWEPLITETVSGYSAIINGLVVNHARLGSLAYVTQPPQGEKKLDAMMLFLMREAIVLVLHIALVFPLAAMALAFAIRIPVLWITMAFMPFVFLGFVGGEKIGISEYTKKIWDHFLKAAFMPAMVGVPLAIGFIMVNAGQGLTVGQRYEGVTLPLLDDIDTFWQFLWLGITLAVMWIGVFTVLKKDEILGKGAGAIEGVGKTLGSIAVKAPLSLPILPGGMSPLFLPKAIKGFEHDLGGRGGIKDALKNLGTGQGAQNLDTIKVAEKITADGEFRQKFEARIQANDLEGAAALLRDKGMRDAKAENVDEKMTAIDAELRRKGHQEILRDQNLRDKLRRLAEEERRRRRP